MPALHPRSRDAATWRSMRCVACGAADDAVKQHGPGPVALLPVRGAVVMARRHKGLRTTEPVGGATSTRASHPPIPAFNSPPPSACSTTSAWLTRGPSRLSAASMRAPSGPSAPTSGSPTGGSSRTRARGMASTEEVAGVQGGRGGVGTGFEEPRSPRCRDSDETCDGSCCVQMVGWTAAASQMGGPEGEPAAGQD